MKTGDTDVTYILTGDHRVVEAFRRFRESRQHRWEGPGRRQDLHDAILVRLDASNVDRHIKPRAAFACHVGISAAIRTGSTL
ncbi:hypothetical protein [Sphingopyxis panaciterrae]